MIHGLPMLVAWLAGCGGGPRWSVAGQPLLHVPGGVVLREGAAIVARDAATGAAWWSRPGDSAGLDAGAIWVTGPQPCTRVDARTGADAGAGPCGARAAAPGEALDDPANGVVVARVDGGSTVVDRATGGVLARVPQAACGDTSGVAAAPGIVVLPSCTADGGPLALVALDARTGAQRWTRPAGPRPELAVDGGVLWVCDGLRSTALDAATGQPTGAGGTWRDACRYGGVGAGVAVHDEDAMSLCQRVWWRWSPPPERPVRTVAVDAATGAARWTVDGARLFAVDGAAGTALLVRGGALEAWPL